MYTSFSKVSIYKMAIYKTSKKTVGEHAGVCLLLLSSASSSGAAACAEARPPKIKNENLGSPDDLSIDVLWGAAVGGRRLPGAMRRG